MLRGGVGLFTGRNLLVPAGVELQQNGIGVGDLRFMVCNIPGGEPSVGAADDRDGVSGQLSVPEPSGGGAFPSGRPDQQPRL